MSGVSLITNGMVSTSTAGTGDWSSGEKEQIRSALGINGTKKDIEDSELSPMKILPFVV